MTEQPNDPFDYAGVEARAEVLSRWQVSPSRQAPTGAEGPCPRCGHPMKAPITTQITISETELAAPAEPPDPARTLTVYFVCACGEAHAGRKEADTGGCGAFWLADLVKRDDGFYILTPTADRSFAQAAIDLHAAAKTQNANVQKSAEKWLGGIAALFGLFSLAGIFSSGSAVAALDNAGKWAAGVVAALAVLTAGFAVVLGYLAAYGWPITSEVANNLQLKAWKDKRDEYAPKAGKRLRSAVKSAAASLSFIVATVGIIWFGPRATSTPTLELTTKDGGSACGSLVSWSPDGRIQLKNGEGDVFTIRACTVAKVTITESCDDVKA